MAYYRITSNNFEAVVNSNLKMVISPDDNNLMKTLISIDVGQNGKLFHKHYDDLLYSHEKANLISIDSENVKKIDYTLLFKK